MRNNKVVMLSGMVVAALAAELFITMSIHSVSAQETNSTQSNSTMSAAPHLNGSVNVHEFASNFVQENVKVPFATALETAQSQVENGTVVSGRLGVAQGYLVYTFMVANYDDQTSRMVIVDAGNGNVLHTSEDMPLYYGGLGGHGFGCGGHNNRGYGHSWNDQGKDTTSDSSGADAQTTSA